jgi:L-threonylcarbamoyladenylate synthase
MSFATDNLLDDAVIDALQQGGVGILPTDTVYGIVACAKSTKAVDRMLAIKVRDGKPGTVLAATVDQLIEMGIKARYVHAVEHYWPNPLSVVIPCDGTLQYLHLGKFSLACRIPKDPQLRALLEKTGPLMSTSANEPGQETAQTVREAQDMFGDHVDFYVDGGEKKHHQPSTIIRIVDDAIEIIREGAVKIDENGRIYQ